MEANAPERSRWNDEVWLVDWARKERLTRLVTPTLIAAANPRPGEAVLDIGCGSGGSTLAAARAVGFWGHVVGVDLSRSLLGRARTLGASFEEGMRARFVQADVQTDAVPGGPFDLAMSQFGVMFFDDPDAAFAAVAGLVRPGGRLAFAVWQASERNPWNMGPVLRAAGVAPSPPPPAPGKAVTGPFTWAEPDHAPALLRRAGFTDVAVTPYERELDVTDDALTGGPDLDAMGIPTPDHERARAAIATHLAPYRGDGGRLRLPMAFQVVTASRP